MKTTTAQICFHVFVLSACVFFGYFGWHAVNGVQLKVAELTAEPERRIPVARVEGNVESVVSAGEVVIGEPLVVTPPAAYARRQR
jgi:hypothetical protein